MPAWHLPGVACSLCGGHDRRRAETAAEVVATFPAQYYGRMACGCFVLVGETIARRADGTYVCADHGGGL